MNDDNKRTKTVLIVGGTGYIGCAVVAEAVKQGYAVTTVTRSNKDDQRLAGTEVVVADVTDPASVATIFSKKFDTVISTLACHSGLAEDFDAIDYRATLEILNQAKAHGTQQFILLSAICVRLPELPLQLAKLKMEDELMRSGLDYTIVRPTAYFWVLDVQTKMIKKGRRGYLVGSGTQAVCNPIAKEDLAEFMVDSIADTERKNRVFVIGGPEVPGNIITYKESLEMIFESLGKEPKLSHYPEWLVIGIIRLTGFFGIFFRKLGVFSEFLKICHYYLVYDMRAPGYGTITFKQHVEKMAKESK